MLLGGRADGAGAGAGGTQAVHVAEEARLREERRAEAGDPGRAAQQLATLTGHLHTAAAKLLTAEGALAARQALVASLTAQRDGLGADVKAADARVAAATRAQEDRAAHVAAMAADMAATREAYLAASADTAAAAAALAVARRETKQARRGPPVFKLGWVSRPRPLSLTPLSRARARRRPTRRTASARTRTRAC